MNSPARTFAGVFGAVYLLVGLVGFAVTGFDDWVATDTNETLLWFELNGLHNLVHILIGLALLAGYAKPPSARPIAATVGATYALVGIIGFFAVGQEWNILSLNHADNWLHIATAILALAAVSAEDRSMTGTRTRTAA